MADPSEFRRLLVVLAAFFDRSYPSVAVLSDFESRVNFLLAMPSIVTEHADPIHTRKAGKPSSG